MAAQFKGTSWHYIKLPELRKMFKLKDCYSRWIDLRRRVLEKAVSEINDKKNLKVSIERTKTGRDVTAIKLRVEEKDQIEMEF